MWTTTTARVRRLHSTLRGYDPDTDETFRLDEPAGLLWVHSTEIDSYAEVAHRAGILDDDGVERYLAESVRAGRVVGVTAPPGPRAAMRRYIDGMRPHLRITDEARQGVGNLFAPQSGAPTASRVLFPVVASLALATLPRWARRMYGLPGLPTTDLGVTVALRGLRGATGLLPDIPAPPEIERARLAVLEANAAAAQPFWERHGFAATGERKPYRYDKLVSTSILFEKPLR